MKQHVFALVPLALLPLLAAQSPTAAAAGAPTSGFLQRTLVDDRGAHRYVVFVPPQYDAARSWPLLVFLNGAGECGTDGWSQVSVGLGPAIMGTVERWPFVVLFPQKPDRSSAWEDHDAMVMAMLAAVRRDYRVDERRLFLTGLSQGGHGTWVLGARHKDLWAAIAPVCGYGDGKTIAGDLAAMPIWTFHGDADKAVSVEQSRSIVAAIRDKGGAPLLSIYPGVGHDSWVRAYRDEPLAAWLLLARDEPVLARYLAEPAAMTSAHIAVTRTVNGSAPPEVERVVATIDLEGDKARWQCTEGPAAAPQVELTGELTATPARELVARQLRALAHAGCLTLPAEPQAPTRLAGADEGWQFELRLEGPGGGCKVARALPDWIDGPRDRAAHALSEFAAMVKELRR